MRGSLLGTIALLAASCLPTTIPAQSVLAIDTQQCFWHPGDDPSWAAPTIDESPWRPYSDWRSTPGQPFFWVRCHGDLSSLKQLAHPAIQVRLHAAYQIYFNGSLIGTSGNLSNANFTLDAIRAYPIPASLLSTATASISLRMRNRDFTSVPAVVALSLLTRLELFAGDEPMLEAMRAQAVMRRDSQSLAIAICYGIIGVIAVMLLGLFFYDRSRFELLYLGAACLGLAVVRENEFCVTALLNHPFSLNLTVEVLGTICNAVTQLLFFFALARRRVPLPFWILLATTILFISPQALDALMVNLQPPWFDSQHRMLFRTLLIASELGLSLAPLFAFWPISRIARRMRPLAGLCLVLGAFQAAYWVASLTAMRLPGIPDLFANWGRPIIEVRAFTTAGVLIGLLILLLREHRQVSLDRALLAGELQAASEIQRMLAPAALDTAPGLKIDVAFHPMRDVGGDFYLCRVLQDGRQRVLLGDVSGKGSAAAMTAALLLGAAGGRDADSPADLLAHLNRILMEAHVGGFATCLCADFASDETAVVANAGHLAPYLRGNEIAVPSTLPLGIQSQTAEGLGRMTFTLESGDTLTLISDGVVEARSATGELFGFDRARTISDRPASEIAQAAQSFGQEDDITVLTITRIEKREQFKAEESHHVLATV